ncbi:quinolinate synthase NadA [Microlunatus sp. Gsoil 973]|uniref:quinolinate synthase NadA n=1 Tax=Microlunatus sp. Gsoil 973 TaxID=2672569 RepID=UPI0012B4FBEE|nr:quinolinate synthase NadA [Microlunatus sp. Gsoil 973]
MESVGVYDRETAGLPADFADWTEWREEVRRLARQKDAVILAHNYQLPQIQDAADHVGDSLALSRIAASTPESMIVFAGVHFMAETAKILAPEKKVIIPDARAGCSLADTINADQLRAWKAEHPGAVVVAYVNTTAEVKAETDICCTSSNAVEVVESIPADQEVLFLPDMFLAAHVRRTTGRTNMYNWMGECHVHAGISPKDLEAAVRADQDAELYVHPECGCSTSALWLTSAGDLPAERTHILSTGSMLDEARKSTARKVLVATEIGMLHQLRKANDHTDFQPVNPQASCKFMKMITPQKLINALQTETDVVDVAPEVAARARRAVERMVAIGRPGGGE